MTENQLVAVDIVVVVDIVEILVVDVVDVVDVVVVVVVVVVVDDDIVVAVVDNHHVVAAVKDFVVAVDKRTTRTTEIATASYSATIRPSVSAIRRHNIQRCFVLLCTFIIKRLL